MENQSYIRLTLFQYKLLARRFKVQHILCIHVVIIVIRLRINKTLVLVTLLLKEINQFYSLPIF